MNLFIGSVNTKEIIDTYSKELDSVNEELATLSNNESLSKSAKVKKSELEKRKEKLKNKEVLSYTCFICKKEFKIKAKGKIN